MVREDRSAKMYDSIIVGAGIWGCSVARLLADRGKRVLVLERRDAVGGNCRAEIDPATGIELHLYGSHIFHTSDERVWNFLRRFSEFNGYRHQVLAKHDGRCYFLPVGLALVNAFFRVNLTPAELPAFLAAKRDASIAEPKNFEEQALALAGPELYEAFFEHYTAKQWRRDPRELSADLLRRLPVRATYDVGYFADPHQGIPAAGYRKMFEAMLDSPRIEVRLNTEFRLADLRDVPTYYSGAPDRLFDYRFGALPWRSLRFETSREAVRDFQGTSVVNYCDADVPYTRIHEFKHYHPEWREAFDAPETVITREFPQNWSPGDEPYYPVNTPEAETLMQRYREAATKFPGLILGGRLGNFRYYDMDKAVAAAIDEVERRTR